ncbi:NitT/TauT family transport system substrate-binding protein [Bradyrhizobium japonicum]
MIGITRLALAGLMAITAMGTARAEDALKARVGVLRLSSSAPVFIAQDKGYFREAGLDVELKFFDAAQPIAVATTSGDIDFGVTAFTAGLYNLAGKGTLKVIGGMSREKAGYPLIGYFASNNAYAAGLKTPKDLAGKRIAVTQVGSSFHYSLGLLADKYGFKLADVKIVPLQSLSNAAAALKGETVDAALLPISTARKLMDEGGAKFLGWVGDETPWQLGAVFASPKTLTNKVLVTKFLGVLAKADREYHDVILAAMKDGVAPINDKRRRWRSSPNTPICRSSRWSAIAPISIPTASWTSRTSTTRSNGSRSRALPTRALM